MNRDQVLRIGVSLGALAIAGVHLWKPDLQIDSITVVLLVISLLPWVQPIIKSIELLGVKLELQELQNRVAEAQGAAESASRQATLALAVSTPVVPAAETSEPARETADAEMRSLAEEYDHIRETQRSGATRTSAMTSVVRRMLDLAPHVRSFDVLEALRDQHGGRRLAAYAYLYTQPGRDFLLPLVESVTQREDKPFGQYWGLQSIARVLTQYGPRAVPPEIVTQLRVFAERIPRGTDRAYELRKIIRDIDQVGDDE